MTPRDPNDPTRRHPASEDTDPPPRPATGLRPPCGQAVTRKEIPTRPRNPIPLPPLPERQPVTTSQVEALIDAALDEERTGTARTVAADAPKAAKAALAGVQMIPPKERRVALRETLIVASSVVILVALIAAAVVAYSLSLGHVPGFLR